jgi:hypothetical protein
MALKCDNYVNQMCDNLKAAIAEKAPSFKIDLDVLEMIVTNHHCGNGYFSYDGLLDDVYDMLGDQDLTSEIVGLC